MYTEALGWINQNCRFAEALPFAYRKQAKSPLFMALWNLRSQFAAAAQAEYDAWEQDEEGIDEVLGGGGIC